MFGDDGNADDARREQRGQGKAGDDGADFVPAEIFDLGGDVGAHFVGRVHALTGIAEAGIVTNILRAALG